MSNEAVASEPGNMNPFVGGDPIESENLGTMQDLVENADTSSGNFQTIKPAEIREADMTQAKYEEAPQLSDAKDSDEADTSAEAEEAEESADVSEGDTAEADTAETTPEDLEDAGEPAEKAEAEQPDQKIMIPKYRLDQEAAKRRAAEDRAKRLQEQLENAAPITDAPDIEFDIEERVKTAFDKVLDGDIDTATQAIAEVIKSTNLQVLEAARADAAKQVVAGTHKTQQATELDTVIDTLESTYAVLNPSSESYNKELVQEVLAMQAGYAAAGMTDAQAMEKAANNALLLYGFAEAVSDDPAQAPVPAKEEKGPSPSIKRKVEAKRQQPPSLPPSSSDDTEAPEIDINQLTEDELFALPESTIRRLRGDNL
jgi:hypothetical protein